MASAGGATQEPDIFEIGHVIDDNYVISARLGKGGYGEIYRATSISDGSVVAVKVERASKSGNLFEELNILNVLTKNGCRHIPVVLNSGYHDKQIHYITMEILGDNLSLLRRRQENHCLSVRCASAIAIQMLRGIKAVHDHGYLHRDIKPGNFVMGGAKDPRSVYIIDYGLSRRYVRPDGTLRQKRSETRWVGSRRYMSPNTHLRKDQGRRDDLWGFLYVLIELLTGTLPWAHLRGIENLDKVRDIKLQYMDAKLVEGLPEELLKILTHISELKWADRPNYRYLHKLLSNLHKTSGGDNDTPYDWEDRTRTKSALGSADLDFSSIHSSNGFTDGSDSCPSSGSPKLVTANGGTPISPLRFHALEDSADFSEDSSARRRKRQRTNGATEVPTNAMPSGATTTTTTATNTGELPNGDAEAPKKKKKKKKKCVIS